MPSLAALTMDGHNANTQTLSELAERANKRLQHQQCATKTFCLANSALPVPLTVGPPSVKKIRSKIALPLSVLLSISPNTQILVSLLQPSPPTLSRSLLLPRSLFVACLLMSDMLASALSCRSSPLIVHFLRHGQATHNVNAEPLRLAGCTYAAFLDQMSLDDEFDARLTEVGVSVAREAGKKIGGLITVDAMLCSPLSRAIDTGSLVLGSLVPAGHPVIVLDEFAEIKGLLLNAKRRTREEIKAKYPSVDVSFLKHEDDVLWEQHVDKLEDGPSCAERGLRGLEFVYDELHLKRGHRNVAVSAHGVSPTHTNPTSPTPSLTLLPPKMLTPPFTPHHNLPTRLSLLSPPPPHMQGIFHLMTNECDRIVACDEMRKRFDNCELRSCEVQVKQDDDKGTRVFHLKKITVSTSASSSGAF